VGFSKVVPPGAIEGIIHRLYADGQREKRAAMEKAISSRELIEKEERHTVVLPQEDIAATVDRLYSSGVRHRLQTHQKLAEVYLFKGKFPKTEASRKEHAEKMVARFYVEEPQRAQKRKNELYQKYIRSTEPHVAKKSTEDILSIVDRLCGKS
jgi:hypothetical protein